MPSTPELQAAVDAARAKLLAMLADPEVRLVRAPRANAEQLQAARHKLAQMIKDPKRIV